MAILDFVTSGNFLAIGVGVAVVVTNLKYRAGTVSNEVINNYQILKAQLEAQIKKLGDELTAQAIQHSQDMNKLHADNGEKEGIIKMQNKIIEQQRATIENRNPNLEKVLGNIENFMRMIFEEQKANTAISTQNSEALDAQMKILSTPATMVL